MPSAKRGWTGVLSVLPAALLAAAGCARGSAPVVDADPSSPSPGPTSPAATLGGSRVVPDYLAYWDALRAAHRAADPSSALLARHAVDPVLAADRQVIGRNRAQQLSVRGVVGHRPTVVSLAAASATVLDCYDISRWNPVDLRTGRGIGATGAPRYRARYTLRPGPSGWLVMSRKVEGTC